MINYTGVVEAPVFFSRIFTEKVVGVVECDTQKVIQKKLLDGLWTGEIS